MITRLRLASAALGLLAAAAGAQIARPWLPRPVQTPGAVFPLATSAAICVKGYSASVRRVSPDTRRRVFQQYGLSPVPGRYELDHLIPLELGGSNAIANLWPEPIAVADGHRQLGAKVKNRLENTLRALVCGGKHSLPLAQAEIATDWVACYQAHVARLPDP